MTLNPRLLTAIRIFVGLVFAVYGVVKIFGGQFYYGDWTMSKATVEGPGLVWAFYGYSPYYGRFIGFCELLPALMLFVPRTATVGAALLLPVALNITVMDFFYGFPSVKWMALLYTALLGVLLWADRAKLLMLIEPASKVEQYRTMAASLNAGTPRAPLSRRARSIAYVVLGVFVLFLANLIGTALVAGPEAQATAAARAAPGAPDDLRMARSRYTGLFGVNRRAEVLLVGGSDTVRAFAHRASGFTPWRIDSLVPSSSAEPPVVLYLHGRIVEDQGPEAVSEEFGPYAWRAIVDSLRAPSSLLPLVIPAPTVIPDQRASASAPAVIPDQRASASADPGPRVVSADIQVIADLRPPSTNPEQYAARVAAQVDSLLKAGVAPTRITVVGFSKGAGIAIRVSERLRRTDIAFVFMGACAPGQASTSKVAGRILSIYEASDSLGQSCATLLANALPGSSHDERRIDTGQKHGAFYQPRAEWLAPVRAWIRTEKLDRD
ncbi:MAG: hypothetical protein H7066_19785 [Cytophagaceae bacterium]|nr:hypothetical protein [Gemmatimonadaceae bacterium]